MFIKSTTKATYVSGMMISVKFMICCYNYISVYIYSKTAKFGYVSGVHINNL